MAENNQALIELLVDLDNSWRLVLNSEFKQEYFLNLAKFVRSERIKRTVYPTPENVFSWTRECNVESVKVVILGQDPYHGANQAHGLAFSVLPGVKIPPSLNNIYNELESDIVGFKRPNHGYLQGWANQGVLLLNAVLTVREGEPNSHKNQGWEAFTDAFISYLKRNRKRLVFMLWGEYAKKKGENIDETNHLVLKCCHPSPLSARHGFIGCKHFSKCNAYLQSNSITPIKWDYLPVFMPPQQAMLGMCGMLQQTNKMPLQQQPRYGNPMGMMGAQQGMGSNMVMQHQQQQPGMVMMPQGSMGTMYPQPPPRNPYM